MTLVSSFTVGALRCHLLEGGIQHLDGGAMFGVVPKPLWEKRIAPDARNRIPLALRCLLVEHADGLVLIDTGIGNKETSKFKDIYGVENDGSNGSTQLVRPLQLLSLRRRQLRISIYRSSIRAMLLTAVTNTLRKSVKEHSVPCC
jgi:hypothetical protein